MKPGGFKEKILLARLNVKDISAFEEIYNFYLDKIYRFIYFKVETKQEAEDLTSQTFLKIWQQAIEGKIKTKESFQAFIYQVARNNVIDHYRATQKKKKNEIELEAAENVFVGQSIEKDIDLKIDFQNLEEKIKHLKNEYQEIVMLHYINELSIKEIATVMNKKRGAVRVLLHRALKALKEQV